mmetsp:Transcript_38175/g.99488  ORF Transcript_38175/g.99488 Transcript_38175/m.99488 type:complete len:315 (-) Transcript_38175:115-1059(-)
MIYIRRQAHDIQGCWVVTLSPTERDGRHLYKRNGFLHDSTTPPTLGWEACRSGDDVESALALGDAPRLEHYRGAVRVCGDGRPYVKAKKRVQRSTQPYVFRSNTNSLQVCIVGASNLQGTDGIDYEPYCVCEIPGKSECVCQTPPEHASVDPLWNHTVEVGVFGSSDVLKFSVKSREVTLGQATLEHSKIYPKGFIGDIPLNMPGWTLKGSTLSLCITPSDQEVPGIHCEVTKGAGRVGLGLAPSRDWDSFSIRSIEEGGQVGRWNEQNPLQQIKIGDSIVEVNGVRGECLDLLKELAQAKGPIKMVVMRNRLL